MPAPVAILVTGNRPLRRLVVIAAAILVMLVGVGALGYVVGTLLGGRTMQVQRVTPDQLATAMKTDEFFSDFRGDALLLRGVVAMASQAGGVMTITFQTSSTWRTECQLDVSAAPFPVGATVTVVTVASTAQRLSDGVLLTGCVLAP